MTRRLAPRNGIVVAVVCALIASACASPDGTAAPSLSTEPSTNPSASASPTSEATPTPTPTPTPAPTCPPIDFGTFVASDRLTDVNLTPGISGDLLGFTLAPNPGSVVRPRLTITPAEPPFTFGGSGLPFEVAGTRHVRIRFEGMAHVDEQFDPVYRGPTNQGGIGGPVRQVVLEEAFEGYVSFVVGYDGSGCVGLQLAPALVTVAIGAR